MGWIDGAFRARDRAPRIVFGELDTAAVDVGDDVDTAEMIVVVEVFVAPFLGGEVFDADPDKLCDHSVGIDLVARERVNRDAGWSVLFYTDAGIIVLHRRAAAAGYRNTALSMIHDHWRDREQ